MIIEEYNKRFPRRNEKYFEMLSNEEKEIYLKMYLNYSNLLYMYLIKKLDLDKFDNLLVTSKSNLKEVVELEKDFYQKLAKGYLKYLYIRNNLYIERLSDSEKEVLLNIDKQINYDNFIESTYQKVMFESVEEVFNLCYGPDSTSFLKPSNIILIGYRFQTLNKKEYDIYYDIREKELAYFEMMFQTLTKEKLNCPVYLQMYDNFSTDMEVVDGSL